MISKSFSHQNSYIFVFLVSPTVQPTVTPEPDYSNHIRLALHTAEVNKRVISGIPHSLNFFFGEMFS
jgi:hypothetical protein